MHAQAARLEQRSALVGVGRQAVDRERQRGRCRLIPWPTPRFESPRLQQTPACQTNSLPAHSFRDAAVAGGHTLHSARKWAH